MSGSCRRATAVLIGLVAVSVCGSPLAVLAQTDQPSSPVAGDGLLLEFNFKNAPFEQVIDYFSRASGKPVIREAPLPEGTLDFLSPERYDLEEGLHVLNIILQSRGVMLRVEDDMLYLQKLSEMQRENIPTFIGELPEDLTTEQMVTIVRPLESASAQALSERLASLVASYGSVTAMPGQNSVVITETVSQVRRLLKIIAELDQAGPDSRIEVFAIQHATAEDLLPPLRALLMTKTVKFMFDKKGKMQRVEEDSLEGLNLAADGRSNAIVAKGPVTSIAKLRDIIGVLDVPSGTNRTIRTVTLGTLSPQAAQQQIAGLFNRLPGPRRPLVVPRQDEPAITISGERVLVEEAIALLEELDGDIMSRSSSGLMLEAIPLVQGNPAAVITALEGLLNQRQKSLVRLVAGPDGRSLLMAGPESDVRAVAAIIPVLDQAGGGEQDVRMIRLAGAAAADPSEVLESTTELHQQRLTGESRLQISIGDDQQVVTLVGPRREIESWIEMLALVSSHQSLAFETRQFTLAHSTPSQIIPALRNMVDSITLIEGQAPAAAPRLEAVDALNLLLASGTPVQLSLIDELIERLDRSSPGDYRIRVIDVSGVDDLEAVLDRARAVWGDLVGDRPVPLPVLEIDPTASRLLLSGSAEAVARFEEAIDSFGRFAREANDLRMIALQHAAADEVASYLLQFSSDENGLLRAGASKPVIEAIDRINTLVVGGSDEQQDMIAAMVASLDVESAGERAPLRILQLQVADAAGLARTLSQQYNARTIQDRAERPVRITADPNTNSLFVSAHPTLVTEIEQIVSDLNTVDRVDRDGREIRIFPLRVARAQELARTIDEMFPAAPMPRDRRGRPMPQLQEAREVVVRADVQTNSLIVEAPVTRMNSFEQLVEQLDRQRVVDAREVRTYQPANAELEAVARTLRQLADSGSLHDDASDRRGTITIATEPGTRTLIVSGPSTVFSKVDQVLEDLDVKRSGPATALRFFTLEHADADRLAETLRQILLVRMREELPGGATSVEALLNVSSDNKTNIVIVSAPTALMPVAETLIEQLDTPAAARSRHAVRIRPLDFADAQSVTASLTTALPSLTSQTTGEQVDARLIASPGANALIMIGLPEDLEQVEALVAALDARPAMDAINAKTYALQHGDALRLAPIVDRLLADQQASDPRLVMERIRRSRGQVDLTPPIRVEADARTNSLIVSGPAVTVALAETLITQLDVPDERASHIWKTFTPARSDAPTLARTVFAILRETSPSGASTDLKLTPDALSGTVVVTGEPAQVDRALNMLASWDEDATPVPPVELRVLTVQHGDAASVAEIMSPLLRDRSRWPQSLQSLDRSGRDLPEPAISVDPLTNRIIVSAPSSLVSLATELLDELDRPTGDGTSVEVQVLALRQADAREVSDTLRASIEARRRARPGMPLATVSAQPNGNAIVVTGTPDQIQDLQELVSTLDEGLAPDQTQVRTVYLEHARAERVAPIVEQLLVEDVDPSMAWFNARRGLPAPEGTDVRVVADPRLNAVIVAATPAILVVAEQMVGQLDVDPSTVHAAAQRRVAVMQVRNADARALATSLESLFGEAGTADPPTIRVDAASNTLLVRGDENQLDRIAEVVQEVDAATLGTTRQVQMVPIDPRRGNAADVAQSLQRMLNRGGGSRVEVLKLEDLMKEAEPPAETEPDQGRGFHPAGTTFRLVTLVMGTVAFNAPSRVPTPPEISLAVDPATNSVVFVGSDRAVSQAKLMLEQLIEQVPVAPGTVRRIELGGVADAGELAALIRQTMQQMTPAGGQRGDLNRRTSVLADPRDNALIVVCTDPDFRVITSLVQALAKDQSGNGTVVKAYPLSSIPADQASRSVRSLLQSNARGRGRQSSRMRSLILETLGDEEAVEAVFRPEDVSAISDGSNNTLIVMAPAQALPFIDRFIELIDQSPTAQVATLKLFRIEHADATRLGSTLRNIFRARHRNQLRVSSSDRRLQEPEFAFDQRTNTLLVTAAPQYLAEIESLLDQLDEPVKDATLPLQSLALKSLTPSRAARLLGEVVLATDPARRQSTIIIPDDGSGTLLVRADAETLAEIQNVLATVDQEPKGAVEVQTLTLARADAGVVAESLQRLFDDRARLSRSNGGSGRQSRGVSIIGNPETRLLMVSASEEDFEEIKELATRMDRLDARTPVSIRAIPLQFARAPEIVETVREMAIQLELGDNPWWYQAAARQNMDQRLAIYPDGRLNSLVVTGASDTLDLVEEIVSVLDAERAAESARTVKIYRTDNAPIRMVYDVVRDLHGGGNRPWWQPRTSVDIEVRVDESRRALIVAATPEKQLMIEQLVQDLDFDLAGVDADVLVVPVKYAEAREIERMLSSYIRQRASSSGQRANSAVIAGRSSNTVILTGPAEELPVLQSLVTQVDVEDASGDRTFEIIPIREGELEVIASILREQFGRRGSGQVMVTTVPRTRSLVLNAAPKELEQVRALIAQLDTRAAKDESLIRTFALSGARATAVVEILEETLQLNEAGEARGVAIRLEPGDDAVEVHARIVADERSNSLVVTATEDSLPIIETLITRLDEKPAVTAVEYQIFDLEHVLAEDVRWNLFDILPAMGDPSPRVTYNRMENQVIVSATPDQLKQIAQVIGEFDQPSTTERSTQFIALEFAEAAKVREALTVFYGPYALDADSPSKLNVRIVADPVTNSLVISANDAEWEGLLSLIGELDSEEYDASLQLEVLPLTYADAVSVAKAINDAFQRQVSEASRRDRNPRRSGSDRSEGGRSEMELPTVLVQAEDWVRASAEPLTNSVVVSSSRKTLNKIKTIVAQLDVADHAGLPPARVIPVGTADPEELAESVRRLYETPGREGRINLRVVGDRESSTLIVRAPESDYLQILALAQALETHGDDGGMGVHVIRLSDAPAARVATAIRSTYTTRARALNAPLDVQVDAATNSLIVAATADLVAEIRDTVEQLDGLAPAAGLGIFIIELDHVDPAEAIRVIRTIGLDQPQPEDSITRLLGEPIKVSPLRGRRAVVVVASPADEKTVTGIFKALDAEPELATATLEVIPLTIADAEAMVSLLQDVLDPANQQVRTPLAEAVQEQIRRLAVQRKGVRKDDFGLDLTQPIRIIAHETQNAILVSSSPANVNAVTELVTMLDQLPVTDAVVVRLFPLENIAAEDFARIVESLFDQGKALGRIPGSEITGVPAGTVGRALLDEVAIAVDERTNTVVIAGKEESVATIEVVSERLDSDLQSGWIEPRLVELTWADPEDLADSLQRILVEGAGDLPQAGPLQRQIGRLRMARMEAPRVIESEVFQPMDRLVIEPQPQMRALLLVGTPINLELVTELVTMLDVEAASPSALVRIYPVEHASAARVAATIENLFREQVATGVVRDEDRVIIQADERTNAVVVTTSVRSFGIFESLLAALDTQMDPSLQEIRRLTVRNASAARLSTVVQRMMDARVERLRLVEPETANLQRATIIPDERTNSLIIAAGNESWDVIQMLVGEMDEEQLLQDGLVEVVAVGDSNPDRLASAVNAVMERRYAELPSEIRNRRQPLVLTDPRTSSLLVSADREDLEAIRTLVERLRATPITQAVDLHVVPVASGSSADRLAPRLQQLMRDRQQSLGESSTPSDRVSITAEMASNSLIVAASQENLLIVENLVRVLVEAGENTLSDRTFEVLALRTGTASDLVEVLEDLYVEEANRNRGMGTVRISADPRLNSILVSAPESDVREIRSLVARLDGARPAYVIEIRHFPLQSANALETVALIEEVLSGRGIGSTRRSPQQTTVLRYVQEIEDAVGGAEYRVSAALRESISLTPDVRTNTIIVRAPRESIELIGRMIRDLDDSSEGAKNIRIFKLENADALAMKQVLIDLFRLDEGDDLLVLKPRDTLPGVSPTGPDALVPSVGMEGMVGGTELTAVPDPRQQLAITVDSRTNSLLVSGSPAYLDLVAEVVDELDALDANERETFVYQLRNATAEDVATVLGDFVEEEQRKLVQTLGGDQLGSAARLLEREITIRGDQKSNTVLVSTSPRYMNQIEEVIRQLDVDPPQVLIQLMLAEVTLSGGFDWGISVDASGTVGSVSLSGVYDLVAGGMALGAPTLSVASSDFDVMLRALESQGRLNILSNPSIMTANNEQATINVGETIYVPTASQTFDTGLVSVPLEAQETGVILNVTPSINPDGFVRLDVQPTLSRVLEAVDQPAVGVETPRILQRTADTTVTVYDGQTIIIGGLIQELYEFTEDSVPILGDLPLIGFLFRGQKEELIRTELVIVLTPHVIKSPADTDRIEALTSEQIDLMSLPEGLRDQIKKSQLESDAIFDRDGDKLRFRDLDAIESSQGVTPPGTDPERGDE